MTKPFSTGGYFPIHNYLFDVCMRRLSNAGWRVLCVAVRQTLGWADECSDTGRKEWDRISYSQFREKSGLASDSTVKKGIEECLEEGYLLRMESKGPHGNAYSLNRAFEDQHYRNCSADATSTETVEVSTTETVEVSTTETVDTKVNLLKETPKEDTMGAGAPPAAPLEEKPPVPVNFEDWLERVQSPPKGSNRTAQLVAMCSALFPSWEPDFGFMGKVARQVGGAGRMAALLWRASGARATGDPVRYCYGIWRGEKGKGRDNGKKQELSAKESAEIDEWLRRQRVGMEGDGATAGA